MSLIHEALEKLEQEKKAKDKTVGQEPFPRPTVFGQEVESLERVKDSLKENRRTRYGLGAAFLLLILLGGLYLWFHPWKVPEKELGGGFTGFGPMSAQKLPPSEFSLTGITRTGVDRTAIINNQLVRVGDWVSGAQVERILEGEVMLDFEGNRIRVSLHGEGPVILTGREAT